MFKYPVLSGLIVFLHFSAVSQVQVNQPIEFTGSGSSAKVSGIQEVLHDLDGVNKIYVDTALVNRINGSETKISAGSGIEVTGIGTTSDPYVVNATSGNSSDLSISTFTPSVTGYLTQLTTTTFVGNGSYSGVTGKYIETGNLVTVFYTVTLQGGPSYINNSHRYEYIELNLPFPALATNGIMAHGGGFTFASGNTCDVAQTFAPIVQGASNEKVRIYGGAKTFSTISNSSFLFANRVPLVAHNVGSDALHTLNYWVTYLRQ